MKRLLSLSAFLLCSLVALAQSFTVDGIKYQVTSTDKLTVQVVGGSSDVIVIPEKVTYEEKEYIVTSIAKEAFWHHRNLTSVTIPNSVTSIDYGAFSGCSGLTTVHITDLAAWCRISFTNSNANPLSCAHHLYLNGEEVKDLVIPNSVTSIGRLAFYGCSGLTSVTIGNSVTSIGGSAFYNCSGLTSVTIPNSVTSIRLGAFQGCSGLTSVNISDLIAWCNISFDSLDSNPLSEAHHLYLNGEEVKDLAIPNSVTSIGNYAFYGCSGLTSVTIPNSVTTIGEAAFRECSGLTEVTIGNSVTSIGSDAFRDCTGLTSITIPNSVTSIGWSAFQNCSGLTKVDIPNSVTSIGNFAFRDCTGLTSITIPNSVTSIGWSAFRNCSGLTSVTIPNSVTSIENYAFSGCSSLTSVTIPTSVTSIGESAFEYCSGLTSVTIPNSVTSIGEYAFSGCSGLTEVISMIEEPFGIETSVWYRVNTDEIPLYVPAGTKEKYEATKGWNVFKNIIEMGIAPSGGEDINYGGGEISGETNLNGNVVGNIYYNIGDENGEYSSAEGCITLRTPVSDEQMSQVEGMDLFGEDMKNNFTGIIFMVQAGSGTIKVNAKTTGNMVLKVKVGSGKPMEFTLSGKMDAELPYEVSEPTYVYIYGGSSSAAGAKGVRKAAGDGEVKIYGISWTSGTNGIETIDNGQLTIDNSPIYNLNGQRVEELPTKKGVYIKNGRKVLVK